MGTGTRVERAVGGAVGRDLKKLKEAALVDAMRSGLQPVQFLLGVMRHHIRMAHARYDLATKEIVPALKEDGTPHEIDYKHLDKAQEVAIAAAGYTAPKLVAAAIGGGFEPGGDGDPKLTGTASVVFLLPRSPREVRLEKDIGSGSAVPASPREIKRKPIIA